MDRVLWISSELMPLLALDGNLDSNSSTVAILSCDVTPHRNTGDHFASVVFFVKLLLEIDGDVNELDLAVKMEPAEQVHKTMMNTKVLFTNEAIMYTEILPMLDRYIQNSPRSFPYVMEDLFPQCYKANYEYDEDSYIVLKNLKSDGFTLNRDIFLDYEKCVVAMQQIGYFHGLSYAFKRHNPGEFYSTVGKLVEARFGGNAEKNLFLRASALRGVQYVKSRVPETSLKLLLSIEKQLGDVTALMQDLVQSVEPLAVLCHGDFCRNNLFFRTSIDSSVPYEMKMFDLQAARYASPAIDTVFLAFMSFSAELRKGHWDSLFQCYHSSVVQTFSCALKVTIEQLGPEFSLQSFKEDFAKHALYGYVLCAFFLPVMMLPEEETLDMEKIASQPPEVVEQIMANLGGDSGTKLVGELLLDVIAIKMAWGEVDT